MSGFNAARLRDCGHQSHCLGTLWRGVASPGRAQDCVGLAPERHGPRLALRSGWRLQRFLGSHSNACHPALAVPILFFSAARTGVSITGQPFALTSEKELLLGLPFWPFLARGPLVRGCGTRVHTCTRDTKANKHTIVARLHGALLHACIAAEAACFAPVREDDVALVAVPPRPCPGSGHTTLDDGDDDRPSAGG